MKKIRQGGNAWNLHYFDHQSAAMIIFVDTIRYYSIPSVPSRSEGVNTRPQVPRFVLLLVAVYPLPLGGVRPFIVLSYRFRLLNYRNYYRNIDHISVRYYSKYIFLIERYIYTWYIFTYIYNYISRKFRYDIQH